MIDTLMNKLREFVDGVAPSPETRMQRESIALQAACCDLLMEVARLDSADSERKQLRVADAMREQFGVSDNDLAALIERSERPENRLTSYFDPVSIINRHFDLQQKALFVEQLWRVAKVDGDIDMYEDHLVRKLSDLLYVPHRDFILAKNRVQAQGI